MLMRLKMVRFLTIACLCVHGWAPCSARATLLLRYTFDEDPAGVVAALDSGSGTPAPGVFIGSAATRTNKTPGQFSVAALSLNGTNAGSYYVSGGDADKLDALSNLTITAWLNLQASPAANDRVVSKLFSDGTRATGFDLRFMGSPSAINFSLGFSLINGQSVSGLPTVTGPVAFSSSNVWTFIAVTYDGAKVRFYSGTTNSGVSQAGSDMNKSASFGTPTNTTADFRIGSTAAATADRTPPAWFDDVRIYDAALTLGELETIRVENISMAPVIVSPPQNVLIETGGTVAFSVVANGTLPLAYQWYFITNNVTNALPQGTNATLNLAQVTFANAGTYQAVVTNQFGSATSAPATLTVIAIAPPSLLSVTAFPTRRAVTLTFDRAVTDSATNPANFLVSGGITSAEAVPDATLTNLTLATSLQVPNASYSLTVTGIQGRLPDAAFMAPITTNFFSPPLYGPLNNVPEAAGWTLLYSLNLPNTAAYHGTGVKYDLDHHLWATNFSRVAYYLELQPSNGPLQFVWAAVDPFVTDTMQLGVPTTQSGAIFQQPVVNLEVRSSVAGVVTGNNLTGGSLKFIPGSDAAPATAGRGAMQLQHHGNVVFTFNGWGLGGVPDLGIGNNPDVAYPDWNQASNAPTWPVKRLLVYVLQRPNMTTDSDIVVYGSTSGGVIAAVQTARLGKRTVLLSPDNHLGGMSSGGLGWTDIGSNGTDYIGGMAREYYRRNGTRYGKSLQFNLEPKVAEQIFGEMLAEAGVRVVFNQHLASVVMNGPRIAQVVMADGSAHRSRMFVDTTYEGDLMAMAGVTFTVGREGTNTYGESYAGVLAPGNGGYTYDPYVVAGNTNSGVLPLLTTNALAPRGGGDRGVQAYNFRLCFSQSATNFLPITAPANYNDTQFELMARYLEARLAKDGAVSLGQLMTLDRPPVPGKYDINANGNISTDFVGESWTWPTNTFAERAAIQRAHEDYTRGLFLFLATSSRVPAAVRSDMQNWGLCRDEFLDTGGWPHTLYVREARRLVGDYVMQQADCQGGRMASDSIGLAAYSMDSHLIQRFASGNQALHEGGMFNSTPTPFPISYRSLIPRQGECENVLCTFALSASHVAFASCRMEPVLMIISQSAATAAAFALDENVPVQQVNYDRLAVQLLADGQQLGSTSVSDSGIIVDNNSTGAIRVGDWTGSSATAGFWGPDYLTDGNTNKGLKSVTYIPNLPTNDLYEVYLRWTAYSNRATNTPVDIVHPFGTNTLLVNQQVGGGVWTLLLRTNFNAGTNARVVIRTAGTSGYVIADAVRFLSSNLPPVQAQVHVVATDPVTSEAGGDPARITFVRFGDTNLDLLVSYTLSGTASNGVDFPALPGSITLPPGVISTSLVIQATADFIREGAETLTITLASGTNYVPGAQNSATIVILDADQGVRITARPTLLSSGRFRAGFSGEPNRLYDIQAATNLGGPWLLFTNLMANPLGELMLDVPATNRIPNRLFRLGPNPSN